MFKKPLQRSQKESLLAINTKKGVLEKNRSPQPTPQTELEYNGNNFTCIKLKDVMFVVERQDYPITRQRKAFI